MASFLMNIMFKFSQLVKKASEPINLKSLLRFQKSKFFGTSNATLKSNKKSNKNKLNRKTKKTINLLMASQVNSCTSLSLDPDNTVNTRSALNSQLANSPKKTNGNSNFVSTRCWEDVKMSFGPSEDDMSHSKGNGAPFTIVSYNILAQGLLELHPYLYENHDPEALKWEFRLTKLSEEILSLKPDILCLQEVQHTHFGEITKRLQALEFEHVYKKKPRNPDGCAIFFNKNLFTLAERQGVEYYQGVEHLDRDNVALITKLCLKSDPNSCFIVSTTHLLYNPRRQDVRLAQIQLLLAELDRVSVTGLDKNNQPIRLPIILTGDFNLQPFSAPYRLITTGDLCYYNLTRSTLETPTDESSVLTDYQFLPPRLGITDNCQHVDIVTNDYSGTSRLRNTEKAVECTGPISEKKNQELDEIACRDHPDAFSSGKLTHDLNLTTVYEHKTEDGQCGGTTFQGKWITVDYIFYSAHFTPKVSSVSEGQLQLIAKYALPTIDECHKIGRIPSANLGSDHLCLAAKFRFQGPSVS